MFKFKTNILLDVKIPLNPTNLYPKMFININISILILSLIHFLITNLIILIHYNF